MLAAEDVPVGAVARIKCLVRAMAAEFSPERKLPQHLLIARISAPIRHESAHRLGSIMQDLVQQGQASGEIRADLDAGLIARLLLTGAFHHFAWFHHPKDKHPPHAASPGPHSGDVPPALAKDPEQHAHNTQHATRNTQHATRNTQHASLEAKLIESVDALMDGLGGPSWRNS